MRRNDGNKNPTRGNHVTFSFANSESTCGALCHMVSIQEAADDVFSLPGSVHVCCARRITHEDSHIYWSENMIIRHDREVRGGKAPPFALLRVLGARRCREHSVETSSE